MQRLRAVLMLVTLGGMTLPRAAQAGAFTLNQVKVNGTPIFSVVDLTSDPSLPPTPALTAPFTNVVLSFAAWSDGTSGPGLLGLALTPDPSSLAPLLESNVLFLATLGTNEATAVTNTVVLPFLGPGIWQGTLTFNGTPQADYPGAGSPPVPQRNPAFPLDLILVPEPASVASLALAAVPALARRRRR